MTSQTAKDYNTYCLISQEIKVIKEIRLVNKI